MKNLGIVIVQADYLDSEQGKHIGYLLNEYAKDPMGGGEALPEDVMSRLSSTLANVPYAFSILCYVDNKPAGLVNCFEGFSTFKCRPLVNIHDVVVLSEYRGLGLSQRMLEKVEDIAKAKHCCKITLEVLEGNQAAQKAYLKFGFDGYELDPEKGKALFWQKNLTVS